MSPKYKFMIIAEYKRHTIEYAAISKAAKMRNHKKKMIEESMKNNKGLKRFTRSTAWRNEITRLLDKRKYSQQLRRNYEDHRGVL